MEIPVAHVGGGPGQATVTVQRAPGTAVLGVGVLGGCSLGMREGPGLTAPGTKGGEHRIAQSPRASVISTVSMLSERVCASSQG